MFGYLCELMIVMFLSLAVVNISSIFVMFKKKKKNQGMALYLRFKTKMKSKQKVDLQTLDRFNSSYYIRDISESECFFSTAAKYIEA